MRTPVTEEDQRAAHELMIAHGYYTCFGDVNGRSHIEGCTAIAQALADRGATTHTEGRREAFDLMESLIDHHLEATEDWRDDLANFRAAVSSARDRGMAGTPGGAA